MNADELSPALVSAISAVRSRKALDLRLLDLREVAVFTDFFLLASGSSVRQVQAIVDAILEQLKEQGIKVSHLEGYTHGEWVLVDCNEFVVHVFLPQRRELYDLERLWSDAKVIEIDDEAA